LSSKALMTGILVLTLAPADDGDEGPFRFAARASSDTWFFLNEKAARLRRQVLGRPENRDVIAMDDAETVADENVGQLGHGLAKASRSGENFLGRFVLFSSSSLWKRTFSSNNTSPGLRASTSFFDLWANAIGRQRHGSASNSLKRAATVSGSLRMSPCRRPAENGGDDDLAAAWIRCSIVANSREMRCRR